MSGRSGTIELPEADAKTDLDSVELNVGDYAVKAFNNDITPFMDVVGVLIMSCGYDQSIAEKIALKIHNDGEVVVFSGAKKRCEEVIKDFTDIGVQAVLIGGEDG